MKKFLALTLAFLLVFLGGCTEKTNNSREITNHKTGEIEEVRQEEAEITLYYADKAATFLVPEVRSAEAKDASDSSFVLSELISGTENDELVNVIPAGTKVNSVTNEDGTCTVDLSPEFISEAGTATVQMTIYSVVNTLCAMEGTDKVQFLIDGEKVMIFGSYIFDEPFEADMSIVK